jgi:hypothetical protein
MRTPTPPLERIMEPAILKRSRSRHRLRAESKRVELPATAPTWPADSAFLQVNALLPAALGVKGAQVQILSSRRSKRAVALDGGTARFVF